MLGKFKQVLGIEGVKIKLILPDKVDEQEGIVKGRIILTTKNKQTVNSILIQVIERFSRGKKAEKRIDEYVIGKLFMEGPIVLKANGRIEKDFEMKFLISQSEMDKFEELNVFYKGMVKIAKFFNKVKSEYRIEVEADVKGTTLNPIVKEELILD